MDTKTFKELRIDDTLQFFITHGGIAGYETLFVKGILLNDDGGLEIITNTKKIEISPCSIDLSMCSNDNGFVITSNLDKVAQTLSMEIEFAEKKIKALSEKKNNAEKYIEILKKLK